MRKLAIMVLLLSLIVSTSLVGTITWGEDVQETGSLVIVGGALRADNDAVYEAFIERAGGVQDAKIGIVPAASGSPAKYANLFVEDMVTRGLDESQVVILPLAVKDDSKTQDVDESLWSDNGNSAEVVQMVENLTGIWFVGGDQLRITEILINSDGSNTPVLDEIWKVYNKGGVIGGSSAGAAIMSELMIAGGDSLNALRNGYTEDFDTASMDYQNEGGLVVTEGLGFFSHGIVDQHFDRKARLGRLVVTAYDNKEIWSHAYGVEENTALIYDGRLNKISVAGTGGVVILDMTYAKKDSGYTGIKVSYLEGNDQYDLAMNKAEMDADKYTTIGYEYMYTQETLWGGPMSPSQRFRDFIAFELVDNEAKSKVSTYLLDEALSGYEFSFSKAEDTEGYWGQSGAADLYSFENVALEIQPIDLMVKMDVQKSDKSYKVVAGDVLWKIAEKFNITSEALIELNQIQNPNVIKVGQILMLP